MTTGTGIFWAGFFVSTVLLYGFTRDRWRWRRISIVTLSIGFVAVGGVGGWVVWTNSANTRESKARGEADARKHRVQLGDTESRVLQRQGIPDTTYITKDGGKAFGYWESGSDHLPERVFFFSKDGKLENIRFLGTNEHSIPHRWPAEDGVTLGISRDSVSRLLGSPCHEQVDSLSTKLSFRTKDNTILRYVLVTHGDQNVLWHGWKRGDC